jgi:serine O-acetyltransferase
MHDGALERFVRETCQVRREYALPVQADRLAREFVDNVLALLFAHFAAGRSCDRRAVEDELQAVSSQVDQFLFAEGVPAPSRAGAAFLGRLGALRAWLINDAQATYDADPAARSLDEVILAYPGFFALACYRVAHALHELGVPLLPRLVTEVAHRQTGIDIHPGASIGRALSIDHGTGIVIGETTVIGNRVRLYQGVTLGALRVEKALARAKRHPTLEDDVVVYANATILGGNTVVGRGSIIGGNVWLTHSVPANSVVTETAVVERDAARVGEPDEI